MLVFPNAKINIGLNVIAKREDGFHNIESIFYPVHELYDVLEIVKSPELTFESSGIEIPGNADDNLCLKAFDIMQRNHGITSVKIHLLKVIPIGAGLGGGSADAAFTLKVLNELFDLNLSDEQLIEYAKELGSDCAFFIKNKPVYAFHKGDEFEEINLDLSNHQIKVHYPNLHISTKEAYNGITPEPSASDLKEVIQLPLEQWKNCLKNDFEKSLTNTYPVIAQEKNKLYEAGAKFASMTGSGSAVYGIF